MRLIDADELKRELAAVKIVIDEDILKCNSVHDELVHLLKKVEDVVVEKISEQPTIEAQPMVHGEWIYEYHTWHCNICGCHPYKGYIPREPSNFCPNCGARMDGKENLC